MRSEPAADARRPNVFAVIGRVGIVVNDSLILVNLANRIREIEPGGPSQTAIVHATKHRLRPILLIFVTTVAWFLPMAYGIGGSDSFSELMALAMGYGILFETPLKLILIPCLLLVLDDAAKLVGLKIAKRQTGKNKKSHEMESPATVRGLSLLVCPFLAELRTYRQRNWKLNWLWSQAVDRTSQANIRRAN